MSSRPLKVLWRAMAGVRPVFALAFACVILAALASLVDPLVIRFTLDAVLAKQAVSLPPGLARALDALGGPSYLARNLWICALALLGSSLVNALFSFLRSNLSAVAAERTTKNLRDRLAAHLDALPASYFGSASAGDLIQRSTSDMDTVRRFLATQVEEVGRALALLALTVVMMASIDLPMTLVSVPVIPAVFAFSYLFFRKIQKAFTVSDEAEAALTQVLDENLHGIRVVRAFARESFEIERFDARNRRFTGETRKLIVLFGWYWGISVLLCASQEVATISAGAARVASGALSAGTYLAFIAYVGRVLWPVRQLGRTLTEVGKALVSLGRITQVLDAPDEFEGDARAAAEAGLGPGERPSRPAGPGRVEVEGLCVEYEAGKPVLRDVSFTAEPGETVAILGRTGSGKSTLAAALVRLAEPSSGRILLDGVDIRAMDRQALRESVALVLQEPYLFSRSLRENAELGTGRLEAEELERSARLSALSAVVAGFEEGWDTAVGEEGVTLSGGQRQRLALARALAKRPRVLVLDDTLSALDTETDAAVRRELAEEAAAEAEAGRGAATTIIVAHRITTLMGADRIVVLEDGRVADIGTHAELLSRPGLYRRVWEIQSAGGDFAPALA
jgi:ATP-binding cassette, subfamily B, bacterial